MIDIALTYHVLHLSGVDGLIGDRLYPEVAPESGVVVPYIVTSRISTPRERHLDGGAGLAHPRFQFSLFDTDCVRLTQLSEAIRTRFDALHGADIGPPGAQVHVQDVVLEDERDGYVPPEAGQEVGLYRKDLDFIIWHVESVPAS